MNLITDQPVLLHPGRTRPPGRLATAGIVAAYTAVFFGVLPALLWTLGARLDDLLALPGLAGVGWRTPGITLAVAGGAWMIWSMALLRLVGGGWPISHLPPVRLVTTGPYRVTRHPIYVGYVALVAGVALAVGSLGGLLAAGVLVVGILDYVAGIESPGLRRRFGGSYAGYRTGAGRAGELLLPLWTVLRRPVEWLANRPVLFRAGPTVWVTYGLFVALGAGVSVGVLLDRLATDGLSTRELVTYLLVVGPAMALGGRLVWFPVAWDAVRGKGFWRALRTVGFVSWGAYIGFFAGSAVYAGIQGVGLLWLLDRTVPAILLCSVIGRIGCLTYGCCFGRAWRHGIRWHAPDSKVVRQFGAGAVEPRVPVQLLSAGTTLLVILLGALVSLRPAPAGAVTGVVMLLYPLGRFAVDSLRDESFGLPWAGGLNLGHVASLAVLGVALALLFTARGAPAWPRSAFAFDWSLLVPLLPALATVTLLTFVLAGFHWRRVGQW